MKIDFSEKEYLALLDMIQVADWVIHANKIEEPEETKPYRDLEQKIFALAKDFGHRNLVEYSLTDGRYYPTRELEETGPAMEFIGAFEEDIFWSQLVEHLADRDLARELGKEKLESIDQGEKWERQEVIESRYWEEFRKNGIERLEIIELPWYETPDMPRA
jgi:hypothetical protein